MHITVRALMIISLLCITARPLSARWLGQDLQQTEAKGSVTGRVTVDGKPAQGIVIILNKQESNRNLAFNEAFQGIKGLKAVTDYEGTFRFNDVPAGRYEASPFAPALVVSSESQSDEDRTTITVSEAKPVENVNFALSRGGVITGRITDAEGRPAIRERIGLSGADDDESSRPWQAENFGMLMTDDRGIYRIYGLPPGRYVVSAGGNSPGGIEAFTGRRNTTRTYYPGASDRAKAKVIEVTTGNEVIGIDIKLSPAPKGPYASGRIIDETGKPVPNIPLMMMPGSGNTEAIPYSGGFTASTAKGEFRFDNLRPGKYRAMAQMAGQEGEFYAEPLSFEVKNEDVTGLEIKLRRGSMITGFAVIEGLNDSETIARLTQTVLTATITDSESTSAATTDIAQAEASAFGIASGRILPDGSFRIPGLRPGKARIITVDMFNSSGLKLSRVERDGAETSSIEIKAGETVTGVKLVFALAKGIIRGKVVNLNGKLPADAYIEVEIYKSGTTERVFSFWEPEIDVDEEGNFVIENLIAGSYDIEVSIRDEDATDADHSKPSGAKQTVIVTNDAPTEVTITIDIKKADER